MADTGNLQNAEEAAEIKKRRTFRKFSYRGIDLDAYVTPIIHPIYSPGHDDGRKQAGVWPDTTRRLDIGARITQRRITADSRQTVS